MTKDSEFDTWSAGQSYEHYMGRWSRKIAAEFLHWLEPPKDADWLEIGCGTGALTDAILATCSPRSVLATDQSSDFVKHASKGISDNRVQFATAEASKLPAAERSIDVVTSALVLNFVPDRDGAIAEMKRVIRQGGLLSFYVWDYPGGGMGFIDAFWKAAASLDVAAADLDEGKRFPFCTQSGLAELCEAAELVLVEISPIEIATEFADFEAYWTPFTLGAGPAPGYCNSLSDKKREALRSRLVETLGGNGRISLTARAWAVKASAGQIEV